MAATVSISLLGANAVYAADKDVIVTNPPANPVPVTNGGTTSPTPLVIQDVDHPARHSFSAQFACDILDGQAECRAQVAGTPPTDKIWVIETVSARVVTPGGQTVGDFTLSANGNYQIPLSFQGTIGAFDYYAALLPVRIYVSTRFDLPTVTAFRGVGSGRVIVTGILSGHLVAE